MRLFQIETGQLENFVMSGEFALNGAVRPVKGVSAIALRARTEGRARVMVPVENAAEAAVVEGLCVIPVRNLREATCFLEGTFQTRRTRWMWRSSLTINTTTMWISRRSRGRSR